MLEGQLQTWSPNNAPLPSHRDSLIQPIEAHDKLSCHVVACPTTCLGAKRSKCRHGNASYDGDVVMVVKRMVVGVEN